MISRATDLETGRDACPTVSSTPMTEAGGAGGRRYRRPLREPVRQPQRPL